MPRPRRTTIDPELEHQRQQVIERLHKIEGQVRGIARMVEDGRDCEAVITQVLAARAALDRTAAQIASGFVGECLQQEGVRAGARISRVIGLISRTG
jgi:DNA-binding FrmR family transcriptional regulator